MSTIETASQSGSILDPHSCGAYRPLEEHRLRATIRELVEEEVSRATLDLRSQIAELRALLKGHRHKVSMQYVSEEPTLNEKGV